MQRLSLHALFLFAILALVGCKKSAPDTSDDTSSTPEIIDDAAEGDGPLKAEFEAELLHTFEGVLGNASEKRPEDNTPVAHHEFDLTEGDHIYVEMNAVDPFRTYLLIATPNETGGYQNSECYPGQGLSSCVRFVADQTGTYLFMANAARARTKGKYTLSIYKETEKQAKKNAEAHAKVAAQSERRLQKHLEQKKKDKAARDAERKAKDDATKDAQDDVDDAEATEE